jgi:hypothetical protein
MDEDRENKEGPDNTDKEKDKNTENNDREVSKPHTMTATSTNSRPPGITA